MTDAAHHDGRAAESLSRREMIAATAAALPAPLLPVPGPAAPPAALSGKFLTPAEYALLDELTELMIPTDEHSPGARAAGAAGYIDFRLSASAEPEQQTKWRSGLAAVEALSKELNNGQAFLQASADKRGAVLTRMAAGEHDPKTPAQHFFPDLKGGTVRADYNSNVR